VACMQGEYGRAVRLLGADETLREAIGAGIRALYRADYNQAVATARVQMGEAAFATTWAEGRAMSLAQAIDEAQRVMGSKRASESPTPVPPSPVAFAGLTPREIEVLRLVAQGLTNAQVAERLVITPRTVNVHLTSIYSKLQVTSRTAATRYAIEHNLI
jgi:DNA-binding NarL/FixJ family response regulator